MKILVVHNRYLSRGGECSVVDSEINMLKKHGHEVIFYEESNDQINKLSIFHKIKFFLKEIYFSKKTYSELTTIIQKEDPDIAHFHNTFLFTSPSAYDACYDNFIPIVQTLHNYRFLCPNGVFFRNRGICEDCLKVTRKAAIVNKCWHDSYLASFLITKVVDQFYKRNILSEKINHFIALSEFSKNKFIANGFDEKKISVKTNFVYCDDYKYEPHHNYGLYIGHLADYKGVQTLLDAYKNSKNLLKIIGDGPLLKEVEDAAREYPNIIFLGRMTHEKALSEIRNAKYIVYPAACYETFGRVVIEAFAYGKPVIVSDSGAPKELVVNGKTGYVFKSGDSNDLIAKVQMLIENETLIEGMGKNAREEYDSKYTLERNYNILISIYNKLSQYV